MSESRFDTICELRTISKSDPDRFDTIQEVAKFNPYHDSRGRFASASSATSFTYAPGKSRAHDLAIQREKERTAAMGGGKVTEAEDRIRGMLRDGAEVKLEGMDPAMADATAKSISTVLEKYPSTKDAFGGFTTDDADGTFEKGETVMGFYDPSTQMIHLNNKYYGNRAEFTKRYADSVEKQFHPQGTDLDSVVVHEMGHAIDNYVSKLVIPEGKYFWNQERISSRMWNNDIEKSRKNGTPLTGKDMREGLSRYAGSNHSEYLAEGFAEYVTSANPRAMATSIGKRLNTYIKKAEKAAGGD